MRLSLPLMRNPTALLALCVLAACATSQNADRPTGPGESAHAVGGAAAEVKINTRAMLLFEDANKTWELQKSKKAPDYASVARKYDAAVSADDRLAEADYNLGVLAERQGNLDEARVHYKAALRKKPSLRQAAENLSVLSQNAGDAQGALSNYGEIARQFPDDPNSRARMAEIYRQAGDEDKAMEFARQALIRDPRNLSAYKTMMFSYLDRKQLALAKLVGVRALKLDASDPEIYYALGLVQLAENHPELATIQFNKSVEQNPGFIPPHVALARLNIKNEDFTNAELHLRRILQSDPKNAEAHLALGVAYKGMGQYDKAMAEYDAAQKLNPNLAAIYLDRGIILHRHKDAPDKALEYYKKYTEMVGVGLAADAPVHQLMKEAEQIVTARNDAKRQEEEGKKLKEMQKRQAAQMKAEDAKDPAAKKKDDKSQVNSTPKPDAVGAPETKSVPVKGSESKGTAEPALAKNPAPQPAVKTTAVKETKDKDEPPDGL